MTDETLTQASLTRLERQKLKAKVVDLHQEGLSFTKIANELELASKQHAHQLYWEAMAEVIAPSVTAMRAHHNELLAEQVQLMRDIQAKEHYALSGGEVVRDPGDRLRPLLDDGPSMAAARELRQLLERQAKLNGVDAPAVVSVNGQIEYQITGVDMDKLR